MSQRPPVVQKALAKGSTVPGRQDDHRLLLPPSFARLTTDQLVDTCPYCGRFSLACWDCEDRGHSDNDHCRQIIYTDGACSRNGNVGATAGIGIASGIYTNQQWSERIPDRDASGAAPTSQQAELQAAIAGLKRAQTSGATECCRRSWSSEYHYSRYYVVATDSEYVVKGITEWYPQWMVRSSPISSP